MLHAVNAKLCIWQNRIYGRAREGPQSTRKASEHTSTQPLLKYVGHRFCLHRLLLNMHFINAILLLAGLSTTLASPIRARDITNLNGDLLSVRDELDRLRGATTQLISDPSSYNQYVDGFPPMFDFFFSHAKDGVQSQSTISLADSQTLVNTLNSIAAHVQSLVDAASAKVCRLGCFLAMDEN